MSKSKKLANFYYFSNIIFGTGIKLILILLEWEGLLLGNYTHSRNLVTTRSCPWNVGRIIFLAPPWQGYTLHVFFLLDRKTKGFDLQEKLVYQIIEEAGNKGKSVIMLSQK